MEKVVLDPLNGSVLKAVGHLDAKASNIQLLKSPVTGIPIDVSAGFPPVTWDRLEIVSANPVTVHFDDLKTSKPQVWNNLQKQTASDKEAALQLIPPGVTNFLTATFNNVWTTAAIIGGLYLWLKYGRK